MKWKKFYWGNHFGTMRFWDLNEKEDGIQMSSVNQADKMTISLQRFEIFWMLIDQHLFEEKTFWNDRIHPNISEEVEDRAY